MTVQEAQLFLGIEGTADLEDLEDAYEEAVFSEASFFIRRIFLPQLADSKIKKLKRVEEAAAALGIKSGRKQVDYKMNELPGSEDPSKWVEWYNQEETRLKLYLGTYLDGRAVVEVLEQWKLLFETYLTGFMNSYERKFQQPEMLEDVKISTAPIFNELSQADREYKEQLLLEEYSRLKKLRA